MISVIIPSHNRGKLIKRTIDSILSQSYKDVEIIVVDDASDDEYIKETQQCLSGIDNILFLTNKTNLGAGLSRKKGFLQAKGEYVLFIDDDDFYCDNSFFSDAVNIMSNDDTIGFVSGSSYDYFLEDEKTQERKMNISGKISAKEYLAKFQYEYTKPDFFASIFRKEILVDSISNEIEMVNDSVVHMYALLNASNAFVLESFVGNYVKHSGNISFNLSCDFIIENMIEKFNVLQKMQTSFSKSEIKRWWRGQINVTVDYYSYSYPSFSDLFKLLVWLIKHSNNDVLFVIKKTIKTQLKIIKRKIIY